MHKETSLPWTTAEILAATQGDLLCGAADRSFAGIDIDSRRIEADQLFVAIKGDRHDGHTFIDAVLRKKIQGLLIAKRHAAEMPTAAWRAQGLVCIAADDTRTALGRLAHYNRQRSGVGVVAITGSNGKTTTRNMVTAVIAQKYMTLATTGNLNNEIGLPLTLFNLRRDHRWAVLELGMNHLGEIDRLGRICEPDIGVITNIGPAHLEGLDTIEGVMHAKGELLQTLKPEGIAVLNADDPNVVKLAEHTEHPVLFYGLGDRARVRAADIQTGASGLEFTLLLPDTRMRVALKTPGRFMVANALAAAAVGHQIGFAASEIKTGLEAFSPVPRRLNLHHTGAGVHIIDDTYNANPDSMRAAIETLHTLKGRQRGILVCGDMLELGAQADRLHMDIGAWAARHGVGRLYATGAFAPQVAAGALAEGLPASAVLVGSQEEILSDLLERLRAGDWLLVKGSRGMRMEKIVDGLLANAALEATPDK